MLGDYNLDPPEAPDMGDDCLECGLPIEGEAYEVQIPGRVRGSGPIWVCSIECRDEYLQGYADHVFDSEWSYEPE
jgi:hypothetical protein